jgi:ligand-binding sensor domain-containing protein
VKRGAGFVALATPFRFINALRSSGDALFVAANEGLFRTRDGQRFERVPEVPERGVNGLALSGRTLWVTSPAALHRVPLDGGRAESMWTPGGSTALQGVSVRGQEVWLASEDRGVLRVRGTQVESYDALRGLDSSWVLDVAVDPHGVAYAATLRHGLFAIDRDGQVRKVDLPSAWLLRLGWLHDRLWVGTQDGLVRDAVAPGAARVSLPGLCVHSLLAAGDTVWVGTETGTFALSTAL